MNHIKRQKFQKWLSVLHLYSVLCQIFCKKEKIYLYKPKELPLYSRRWNAIRYLSFSFYLHNHLPWTFPVFRAWQYRKFLLFKANKTNRLDKICYYSDIVLLSRYPPGHFMQHTYHFPVVFLPT